MEHDLHKGRHLFNYVLSVIILIGALIPLSPAHAAQRNGDVVRTEIAVPQRKVVRHVLYFTKRQIVSSFNDAVHFRFLSRYHGAFISQIIACQKRLGGLVTIQPFKIRQPLKTDTDDHLILT